MCGSSMQDWWLDTVMRGMSRGRSSTRSSRMSWLCTDKEFIYSEEPKVMWSGKGKENTAPSQSECREKEVGLTGPQVAVWSHHAHHKRAGYPPAQTGALWERPCHLQGHENRSAAQHLYSRRQPRRLKHITNHLLLKTQEIYTRKSLRSYRVYLKLDYCYQPDVDSFPITACSLVFYFSCVQQFSNINCNNDVDPEDTIKHNVTALPLNDTRNSYHKHDKRFIASVISFLSKASDVPRKDNITMRAKTCELQLHFC